MAKIKSIHARKILDSRANWTVEVEVNGVSGASPAGASTGTHEVPTVPADIACDFINNKMKKAFLNHEMNQKEIDRKLKFLTGKIGSNGAIATSFAVYNFLWDERQFNRSVFPYPLGNVFGGGAHGGSCYMQEVLLCPKKAKTFPDAVQKMTDAYHELKKELKDMGLSLGMNDEGALTANIGFMELMDILKPIADHNGCAIGLDIAASEMYRHNKYYYRQKEQFLNRDEQIDFVNHLIKKYNLFYVEDPMNEDDFDGFSKIHSKNKKTLVTGDDLTTTNTQRIQRALGKINAMIVKPNQIGTVTQAFDAISLCKKSHIIPVMSHRSGETTDATIARMALDFECPIIKCGIADMRTAKINELLRLWDTVKKPKMGKM
ncbi:MAG: hypothetical protein KAT91_01090 [Candidatus Aenigmarchaeota archaeon]|nr:hypothetical protein [Candidatus Aenigmarchaeota archaeon]